MQNIRGIHMDFRVHEDIEVILELLGMTIQEFAQETWGKHQHGFPLERAGRNSFTRQS